LNEHDVLPLWRPSSPLRRRAVLPDLRHLDQVEVARGLIQLAGYLGAWAAFGDWCNSHQPA